jgi:hypothetical protein
MAGVKYCISFTQLVSHLEQNEREILNLLRISVISAARLFREGFGTTTGERIKPSVLGTRRRKP